MTEGFVVGPGTLGTTGGTAAVDNLDLTGLEGTGEMNVNGAEQCRSYRRARSRPPCSRRRAHSHHRSRSHRREPSRCRANCCNLVVLACGRGGDLDPTNHQGSMGVRGPSTLTQKYMKASSDNIFIYF